MRKMFGKTWWGEQWLRSLANVDYDNRLPRGVTYARNGSVKEIKIKENLIRARVAGSRPSPYRVTLVVPPFFKEEVEILMQEIIKRPTLISRLLNRELDPELLSIAESAGLRVFPRQWTDFKMQCSCPDWAVPCKHLASVIYMMSREIDNNPFLVFEIHKVNLIDELNNRGIYVADPKKTEIPVLASFLKTRKAVIKNPDEEKVYGLVDFSRLNDITEALVHLLPDAPPFYPGGNFREKFSVYFVRNARTAARVLGRKQDIDTLFTTGTNNSANISPEINHYSTVSLSIDGNFKVRVAGDNHALKKPDQLIPAIYRLNPDHLPDYQPSVAAFYKIVLASLHLIAKGNTVPQIVQLTDKNYIIRWIPAMIDSEVRHLTGVLDKILPPGLLMSNGTGKNSDQLRPVTNQTHELLSIIISCLVDRITKISGRDPFVELFFKNTAYPFNGPGESALSGGIKVWLDRFHLSSEIYKPVITVSELDNEQFEIQVTVRDDSKGSVLPVAVKDILQNKQYEKQRFRILQSLSLLSPFIRGLDEHINSGGQQPVIYSINEFAPFLMEMLPAVRLLDIMILLPKSLQELIRPKPTVKLRRNPDQKGYVRLEDLLSFDWQIAIGDTVMAPEEFARLLKNASGLFHFKENYIYVSEADMERLSRFFNAGKPLNSYQMLQTALSGEYEGAPVLLTAEVRELIRELTSSEDITLPQGLNAILRPYQQRGYSWMYRNSRIGFGSIIADDMGLGKTLQVIALLLKLKEENAINAKTKAMVVVPTGLLTNWQSEILRFAPSLSSHIYHGGARDIRQFDADVMLTSYGVLRSDADQISKLKWQVLIIDEAQNIKNHDTAQSRATKSIPAAIRIAMSGTPVENRLTEFWSIMDFANKGYLGNEKTFRTDFAEPIQVYNDEQAVARFRKITSPFMLRRMKTDKTIISDLPDKVEQNQYALLTGPQAALYEKTMQAAMDEIEGITSPDNQALFKRQGLVLQMILALKQICNHPANFLKNGISDASLSGKTELLLELLESIIESGDKVLIFTQFREMGDLLERIIQKHFDDRPLFYHGGCNVTQRQELVERFQNNRADKIFILSLKAGGTGLNLTAASHVIHYDLWWNPAVENQATDRAFRIGQKKNVMVHRFITKNTFEERIDEMIRKKKHLAEMTVATGENWIGKLSNKELREIFAQPV